MQESVSFLMSRIEHGYVEIPIHTSKLPVCFSGLLSGLSNTVESFEVLIVFAPSYCCLTGSSGLLKAKFAISYGTITDPKLWHRVHFCEALAYAASAKAPSDNHHPLSCSVQKPVNIDWNYYRAELNPTLIDQFKGAYESKCTNLARSLPLALAPNKLLPRHCKRARNLIMQDL
jgi:hypothetical protein